ncbi:YbaK/EbsC family protein [Streptomyces sp. NPDC005731]|uniref:YbaK/EbsC family protein n=1 Tax=Streptomyces sp. NPDC005731 TaxID=3157056 RepID=UPI0033E6CF72
MRWSEQWPERCFAVEGAGDLGGTLAQQLVAADVPSGRARASTGPVLRGRSHRAQQGTRSTAFGRCQPSGLRCPFSALVSALPLLAVGRAIGALRTNQIPKTLALRAGRQKLLLVTRGDTRLDNAKCRRRFGINPRMVPLNETEAFTGQPVGGLAPSVAPARSTSTATNP